MVSMSQQGACFKFIIIEDHVPFCARLIYIEVAFNRIFSSPELIPFIGAMSHEELILYLNFIVHG